MLIDEEKTEWNIWEQWLVDDEHWMEIGLKIWKQWLVHDEHWMEDWMENRESWLAHDEHWMEDWMEDMENGWLKMNIEWKIGLRILDIVHW